MIEGTGTVSDRNSGIRLWNIEFEMVGVIVKNDFLEVLSWDWRFYILNHLG